MMANRFPVFVAIVLAVGGRAAPARSQPVQAKTEPNVISLENGLLAVRYDTAAGMFTARRGGRTFITEGRLADRGAAGSARAIDVRDPLGAGKAIEVTWPDGRIRRLALYESLPLVCATGSVRNTADRPVTIEQIAPLAARLDAGSPPDQLRVFGPEGPCPIADFKTHFCFAAAANHKTRAGIVCGWITHHRGSGVVALGTKGDALVVEGQSQYGRLLVPAGATAEGEALGIGFFDDALAGLEDYAGACAKAHQVKLPAHVPSGYCTWYHAGPSSQKQLAELASFAAEKLKRFGFDFVQIDDGWQIGGRDFTTFNPKGPYGDGMKPTADRIRKLGLTAGIWFIPFGWDPKCPALAAHHDWFIKRPDGSIYEVFWAGSCLDATNPQTREFVRKVVAQMTRDWGYKYIKIDGLWSGMAVKILYPSPAYRPDEIGTAVLHDPSKTQVEAYRDGLRLVREAAGPDVFILGCNIAQNARTLGGSIGLVDGMRIGHDIGASWGAIHGGALPVSHFYFFHKRVWFNDPDCLMIRSPLTLDQARLWGSLIALSGQMNVVSEWLPGLPPERLDVVKRTMPNHQGLGRPLDLFEHDPPRIWHYRTTLGGQRFDVVGLFNWDDKKPADVAVSLEQLGLAAGPEDRCVGFDFWEDVFVPPFAGELRASLRPSSCRVIALQRCERHPQLVGTSRHVTQGAIDVAAVAWNEDKKTLNGRSTTVAGDPYEMRIVAPPQGDRIWTALSVTASEVGQGREIKVAMRQDGAQVRVRIENPPGGDLAWSVTFRQQKRD
jgi:hypothetical protein